MSENVSRETMTVVPMFTYGSLRPNANGASWLLDEASIAGPWPATAEGELYYHECRAYPVMTCDGNGLVIGNMYLVDENSREWQWIVNMELDAGYQMRWHEVVARQSDGEWATTKAVVFDWPHGTDGLDRVPGDDWMDATWAEWPEMKG